MKHKSIHMSKVILGFRFNLKISVNSILYNVNSHKIIKNRKLFHLFVECMAI
jgi:hypothetical protein